MRGFEQLAEQFAATAHTVSLVWPVGRVKIAPSITPRCGQLGGERQSGNGTKKMRR